MFLNSDNAHLVLGILVGGLGGIFFLTDREGRSSRPIALCLFVIGLTLLIEREGSPQYRLLTAAIQSSLESVAILAGFKWGRRIGQTASGGLQTAANWLFRIAQLLGLGYWLLSLLYIVLFPKQAASFEPGVIRIHILQAAMLAPILGAALICSVVAIGLLLLAKIDKAEAIRL